MYPSFQYVISPQINSFSSDHQRFTFVKPCLFLIFLAFHNFPIPMPPAGNNQYSLTRSFACTATSAAIFFKVTSATNGSLNSFPGEIHFLTAEIPSLARSLARDIPTSYQKSIYCLIILFHTFNKTTNTATIKITPTS